MKNLKLLSVKDIMRECDCTKHSATKIRKDIAFHFSIDTKKVTLEHLQKYLRLK